jgi:hypothetical protein
MSALAQKRTLRGVKPMSALPPKADIRSGDGMSAFCHKRTSAASFDHIVGATE